MLYLVVSELAHQKTTCMKVYLRSSVIADLCQQLSLELANLLLRLGWWCSYLVMLESSCVLDGAGCCRSGDGLVKWLTKCVGAVNSSSGLKTVILCWCTWVPIVVFDIKACLRTTTCKCSWPSQESFPAGKRYFIDFNQMCFITFSHFSGLERPPGSCK